MMEAVVVIGIAAVAAAHIAYSFCRQLKGGGGRAGSCGCTGCGCQGGCGGSSSDGQKSQREGSAG
jgi:hypothetical protein